MRAAVTLVGVDNTTSRALPPVWSPSALNTFIQCPLAYWWKYGQGWRTAPTVATAAGSITHDILETLIGLPADERTGDAARATYREKFAAWKATGELPDEQVPEVRARIGTAMTHYLALEDPTEIEPVDGGLEMAVAGTLSGVPLEGRADRVEFGVGGARVVDYKTGAAKPRYATAYWRQQMLYAAALCDDGLPVTEVDLLYLGDVPRRLRRPTATAAMSRATDDLVSAAEQREQYSHSAQWEARDSALCSFCPFARACPARRSSTTPTPGTADSDRLLRTNQDLSRRTTAPMPAEDSDIIGDPEEAQ